MSEDRSAATPAPRRWPEDVAREELGEQLARVGVGATFSHEGWVRLTFFPEGITYEIAGRDDGPEVEVRRV